MKLRLQALPSASAVADVIKCEVGAVTPSDVELASTFGAPIFAFNVGASGSVREACRRREVPYTRHDIVYSLVDDVASYLSSKLPPDRISKDVARAEVLQLFTLNNGTTVIGCRIVEGTFPASAGVRVARSGEVIETDARGVASLRRVKDVVSEVAERPRMRRRPAFFRGFATGEGGRRARGVRRRGAAGGSWGVMLRRLVAPSRPARLARLARASRRLL